MTDQPMPTPGMQDVTPVARGSFLELLERREIRGIATYGTTLQTFNGRDAIQDALEEAIDLWQYLVQIRMERDVLLHENARLQRENAALREARACAS